MRKRLLTLFLCLLVAASCCGVLFVANGAFSAGVVAKAENQNDLENNALNGKSDDSPSNLWKGENSKRTNEAFAANNFQNNLTVNNVCYKINESESSLFAADFAARNAKNTAIEGEFSTTAQSCCVMERSSGRILFEKNAHLELPMASTTKIVTALAVLNNCLNLEKVVKIPRQACGVEGSSIYLREGEHLTVRELLLGLMLRSGNDCAVALALEISGSVEKFAALMNQTAASLGCTESNFVTPHGLHHENHYTSAADLAKITCAALQNEDFRQIVGTQRAKISNEGMDYPRVLINKNKLLASFDGADGVKTGYTKKAGRCFVGSATRSGMQVVVVVLNCGPMFEETAQMLNTAFSTYTLQNVIPKHKLCGAEYVQGKPTYYYCEEAYYYPLKSSEKATLKITLEKDVKQAEVFVNDKIVHVQQLKGL